MRSWIFRLVGLLVGRGINIYVGGLAFFGEPEKVVFLEIFFVVMILFFYSCVAGYFCRNTKLWMGAWLAFPFFESMLIFSISDEGPSAFFFWGGIFLAVFFIGTIGEKFGRWSVGKFSDPYKTEISITSHTRDK